MKMSSWQFRAAPHISNTARGEINILAASPSWMETKLVSFISCGDVKQMGWVWSEVFSGVHIGELCVFNILLHKIENTHCQCVCERERGRESKREDDWEDCNGKTERIKEKCSLFILANAIFLISFKSQLCSIQSPHSSHPDAETVFRQWFLSGRLVLAFDLQVLSHLLCTLSFCSAVSPLSLHIGCMINRVMKGILFEFSLTNQIKRNGQKTYITLFCAEFWVYEHLDYAYGKFN